MKKNNFFPSLFLFLLTFAGFWSSCDRIDPISTEFYLPGEWESQQSVWIGWATYENRAGFPTNEVHINMIKALAPNVMVDIAVQDDAEREAVKTELLAAGITQATITERLRFHTIPHNDIWWRDMGGIFLKNANGEQKIVDFNFNGWGYGPYTDAVGKEGFALDEGVDRAIAAELKVTSIASSMIMEGGGIESNGKGTLLITASVLFQRNPNMTKPQIEAELKRVLNAKKIIWLPRGVGNDVNAVEGSPYLINGEKVYTPVTTGGHTDEFVRFIDSKTLLLAEVPASEATDTIARFSRKALLEAEQILKNATDQDGQPFTILRIPETGTLLQTVQPGDGTFDFLSTMSALNIDPAATGITVVLASSYLNYVVTNGVVLMPKYARADRPAILATKDAEARKVFEKAFPTRKIVEIDVTNINVGGGGMHCITQQVPK